MSERNSRERIFGDRQGEKSFRDRGREGDRVSERYSRERISGDRQGEKSFRDRGREGDRVSERYSRDQTFGDRQAGKKVTESKDDDTRHLAYKQYVERRDSRPAGKCSASCHKFAKDLTQKIIDSARFTSSLNVIHTKWS